MNSTQLESRIGEFMDRCRSEGIRITPQRLEILRALLLRDDHPSAEDVYAELNPKLPGLSVDTVYRTLSTLQELGMIQRLEVLDDRGRFEANTSPHHHLVCIRCRKVEDIDWNELDALSLPSEVKKWGKVERPHAELRGVCSDCLADDA